MAKSKQLRLVGISFSALLVVSACASLSKAPSASPYDVMLIDSSYAPLETDAFKLAPESCYLFDEGNNPIPETGECFDKKAWADLKGADQILIAGYLDSQAKKDTPEKRAWDEKLKTAKAVASDVKSKLQLTSHGTRAAYLVAEASGFTVKPLLVRSTTTQAGATGLQNKIQSQGKVAVPRYGMGCNLANWPNEAVAEFEKGRIQEYQERIANLLRGNKSVRVVNISLGYKKSWIQEDNPKCGAEQIEKEFKVLQASWKNLFAQFPDRLFVVSAGNESEDFSQAQLKENDLWAALAETPNLLLVGSLDVNGKRAAFSNFGIPQIAWEKGMEISLPYPHPNLKAGYLTNVGGTSASSPIVAGEAARLLKDEKVTVESVRKALLEKKSPN